MSVLCPSHHLEVRATIRVAFGSGRISCFSGLERKCGGRQGQLHSSRPAEFLHTCNAQAYETTDAVTAIVTNAKAGLHFLRAQSSDLEEARQALNRIPGDGRRAGDIVVQTQALMRKVAAAENATVPQLITRPVCRFGVAYRLMLNHPIFSPPRLAGASRKRPMRPVTSE
jgi:hypothetical protein